MYSYEEQQNAEEHFVAECNNSDCTWMGPVEECVYCGGVGPLCPECHETVEVL